MPRYPTISRCSRRDFLKLEASGGAAIILLPFLAACDRAPTATPIEPTRSPTGTATRAPTGTPSPTAQPSGTPTSTAAPSETPAALTAGLDGLDIEAFIDESVRRLFLRDPEVITVSGLSALLGVRNDKLTDVSNEYIQQTQRLQAGILDLLKKYDRSAYTPSQVLEADIYEWYLDDLVRGFPFAYNDYLVMPFVNSLNWNLQFLFTEAHPFTDVQDVQDYLARLSQVKTKLEQAIDGLKRRQTFGVMLPKIIIPILLADLKQFTGFVDSHPYYVTLVTKINRIPSLKAADRQNLLDQAKEAIKEKVEPGYQTLIDHFKDQERAAPSAVGVWRYSNGADYYAHILRHHTTTEFSAQEIHQLGLEHVRRIQGEMHEAFGKLGYPSGGSLAPLIERLSRESGFVAGQAKVAAYEQAIDLATGVLAQAFDLPLHTKIAVVGGKEGNYFTPPPRDGSRPPVFQAATENEEPSFRIKSTAFHEAVPGHGYQFDVARQMNLPLSREAIQFDGYIEGWAVYAERLMWELGAYQDDPAGNLGRLEMELRRAIRCVVDTGIHSKKWTYDQAVQYTLEASGSRYEGEVLRYIMYPAQATSYYVGFLKVLELRQKAEERLGSRFDLKAFHRILLGSGQVPLAMLEQMVDSFTAVSADPKL